MEVVKTNLPGVKLVNLYVFKDHRGECVEMYNKKLYQDKGIKIKFIEDVFSVSYKNVLRGIHVDSKSWKLVSCLLGGTYLLIVNCEKKSSLFGKWQSFDLSDQNRSQVLVPPNHGIAHLALTEKIIFHYKLSEYYDRSRQSTYKWDDKKFKISWPIQNPILSQRDIKGHYVNQNE